MKPLFLSLVAASLVIAFYLSVEAIADESLVLYFDFDAGKGDVVKDLSQYKNDGKIDGDLKWVEGKLDNALLFEATGMIEVPHDRSLDLVDAHTISYWLKWDGGTTSWSPFVAKRAAEGANYQSWVGSDRIFDYYSGVAVISADTPIPLGEEWLFLTTTHDGKDEVSFYIDGSLDSTKKLPTMAPVEHPLLVGDDGQGNKGVGTIDELAIFNVALTEAEIKKLMEGGIQSVLAIEPFDRLTSTWGNIKAQR